MSPPPATFFAGVRAGAAPLLLWALHFALSYAGVAVGCTALLQGGAAITPPLLRIGLALVTALALAATLALLWQSRRALRREGAGLLSCVRIITAALAAAAIAWTGLPLALLPLCQA